MSEENVVRWRVVVMHAVLLASQDALGVRAQDRGPEERVDGTCVAQSWVGYRKDCTPGLGKDLSRCDLRRDDLIAAAVSWSDFTEATLARSMLARTKFAHLTLAPTCLADGNLRGATLSCSTTTDARFCDRRLTYDLVLDASCDGVLHPLDPCLARTSATW